MAGTLRDRIGYLTTLFRRPVQLRHVGTRDALQAAFGSYHGERRRLGRKLVATPIDADLTWVHWGDFGVCWPTNAPIDRLLNALVELRVPGNFHYYFSPLTEVPTGAVVLDVGSCEGSFAFECLLHRGASRVCCFEPDARMARAIGIAAERNRVRDQIEVVQTVLDLREGTASFVEQVDPLTSAVWMGHASQPAGHVRTVSQRTLDGWVGSSGIQRVDFVKIDAEGSDLAILQGGTETLRRFRPAIAVTTYHAADHCNRLVQLLDRLNLGYRWRAKGMISYEGVPRPVMLHAVARR